MLALKSILVGILGGISGIFPISLSGHFIFLKKTNETVMGTNDNLFGNDTIFFIYLAVFIVLFLFQLDKISEVIKNIKNRETLKNCEEGIIPISAMCVLFYIPAVLFIAFFENKNIYNFIFSAFIWLNVLVVVLTGRIFKNSSDNNKLFVYTKGIASLLGGLTGMSETSALYFSGLFLREKPLKSVSSSLFICTFLFLIKTVVYFIKALIFGFNLSFFCYFLIFVSALISAFFAVGIFRKLAIKKKYGIFCYYIVIFALFVSYTLIKG